MNTPSYVSLEPMLQPIVGSAAEVDRLGDEIAELSAHLDAATARLLDLIREFDARGGWNTGFHSCAAWLSWRVGLDRGAARERVRVARALGTLPRLAKALGRGELSYSKVRALTRVATPETEERLLAVGRAGTAEHVERIVRGWRRVDRQAEVRETARRHASRALHVYQDEDGMVVIRGRLAPEVGAVLVQALTAARQALYQQAHAGDVPAETPPMGQQQADALVLVAEAALHHGIDPGTPAERYQVVVHVDAPWRSVRERGPSRRRCGARFTIAIAAAASRVAASVSARGITSVTGRMAALPHFRISLFSVVGITARFTKRATRSSDTPTESCASAVLTGDFFPRFRLLLRCQLIPSTCCDRGMRRKDFTCTLGRPCPAGWESGWTSAGRSTSC